MAVPTPHAPFIRKAVTNRGIPQPPPKGRPLRGSTTINATNDGRMAPNKNAATQYHPRPGNRHSTKENRIPHIPPQKDREKTAGTPNGLVEAIGKGANGAKPADHNTKSVSWWNINVARKPAVKAESKRVIKKVLSFS